MVAGGGANRALERAGRRPITPACPATSSPSRVPPGADRPRILLADDNADMREYARRLLSGRDDVTAVADGMAALAAARHGRRTWSSPT